LIGQVGTTLGEMWAKVSDKEKARYVKMLEKAKTEYADAKKKYDSEMTESETEETTVKKDKKLKNVSNRAPSAYNNYMKKMKKENSDMTPKEITEQWNSLSTEDKNKYKMVSEQVMEEVVTKAPVPKKETSKKVVDPIDIENIPVPPKTKPAPPPAKSKK